MRRSGTIWDLSDLYRQGFIADEAGLSYKFRFEDVDGYDARATRKELGLLRYRPVIFTSGQNPEKASLYERWATEIVILLPNSGIQKWLNLWLRFVDRLDH